MAQWRSLLSRLIPSVAELADPELILFRIKDVDLQVPDGKTMVILGPSGCGKSTILRIIAGLMAVDTGEVRYDGVAMGNMPPGERQIGMVFQNYALYPNFTVKDNILAHYLFSKRTPGLDQIAKEKFRKTSELLGVEVEALLGRMPNNLSGGEKQRVALGRCITRDPVLFLMDEPLSNLDSRLREKYRINLKRLLKHFGLTSIYVTHDQQEALMLGDLLAIMNQGEIEQQGSFDDIYRHPKNVFVAEFMNLEADTPAINWISGKYISPQYEGRKIGVRPEEIEIFPDEQPGSFLARVTDRLDIPIKKVTILDLNFYENFVSVSLPLDHPAAREKKVWLRVKSFHVFDKENGSRLQSIPTR